MWQITSCQCCKSWRVPYFCHGSLRYRPPFYSANPCIQKQASSKPGRSIPRLELPHEAGLGCSSSAPAAWVPGGKGREGKEECLGRWQRSNETCKCQQCFLAFLEQENGPADMSWSLAKHVGGHVVNLLVAAVAKKPSSHVGTVAGGRERERRAHVEIRLLTQQILLFACRKRGIFASRDLGTR